MNKYHCNNKPRPRIGQLVFVRDGWANVKPHGHDPCGSYPIAQRVSYVAFRFATECRFAADGYAAKDKLCDGCEHQKSA